MTLAAAVVVALPVTATASSADPDRGSGFRAVVRYTEHGVPHIKADTFAGAGYGYGYTAAKDNICQIADLYVTLSAQRSRHFGPSAPANPALGSAADSLTSDLYFQQVNDSGVIERAISQPPPLGPRHEAKELARGYVAGYNRYVAERKITDPACRDAAWVRPIAEIDLYRHLHSLTTIGGAGGVIGGIVTAQPPAGPAGLAKTSQIPADVADRVIDALGSKKDMGSNAFAVGKDASANGRGLLLGNPHYPWHGGRRFWQAQLTVPGRMDVSGASILGLPLIQMGYNRDVAWSHTVATPNPFSLYQLQLVPGSPTTYLVDGKPEQMTSRKVKVQSRNQDGSLSTVERTLWSSRYGPLLGSAFGLPIGWSGESAFALKDANEGNVRGLNTWFEMGVARDTKGIVKALSDTLGAPWVNTIAADRAGNATYADIQTVPHITDEMAKQCNTALGASIFPRTGVAVLDGARASCAWGSDPDAVVPGLLGPSRLPLQTRGDYVSNSNDSAWLANLKAPITGYPRIVGDIGTERGPRTRMGLTEMEGQKRFSRQSIQDMLFNDRSKSAELAVDGAVQMCATLPDVADACQALSKWDKRFTTSSRGAMLFQRFWLKVPAAARWKVPFSAADPVGTPNTLNADDPAVRKAFVDAVAELRAAKIPFDAPLGDHQVVVRNGERIPVHGGHNSNGVLNMLVPTWDPARGNVEVVHGSSYIQAVSYDGDNCPDVQTLLTYSQSADPTSPYYSDQTKLFSQGKWVKGRFCEREILTSPQLKVVFLKG